MADKLKNSENLQGRVVDGVWQPWGGNCRCRLCVSKAPNHGYYRAPRFDYERDAREDWSKMYVPGTA